MVEFPPRPPLTNQFTAVLVVPEIVAVNCFDWPTCTLALVGEIETETEVAGGTTVTLAFAWPVPSEAVTMTDEFDETCPGAV